MNRTDNWPIARLRGLRVRWGLWAGPVLRLGSYGWAYVAQFVLTLTIGVDRFAVYVAATALGMMGAYGAMAGVSDILTRQWVWLTARRAHLWHTLLRFVIPRLLLAFAVPAVLATVLERYGWIQPSGAANFWLLVGGFGLLSVTIDLCGVMLACLGRPSLQVIVSNGLLGASFFTAAIMARFGHGLQPDVVLFHVAAQVAALVIVATELFRNMKQVLHVNERAAVPSSGRPGARISVTVTGVHALEILRAHLPILLIQGVFQSAAASALVASIRFSRAVDVMSVLAIAQNTRDIISGGPMEIANGHRRARRLCLLLATAAMIPVIGVVTILCHKAGLAWDAILLTLVLVATSSIIRQVTAIEIWMSKVVKDPAPALRAGVTIEILRFLSFALVAALGGLYASVATMVLCDAILLIAMLRLSRKVEANG